MARAKKATKRGSPEAIAKRRAARALNKIFEEGGSGGALDGRTLKRKKRLIDELKKGRRGKALKAHEVLAHATELLTLGETLTSLRKLKPLLPPTPAVDGETSAIIVATQSSYSFDPRAWRLLGIDIAKVMGEDGGAAAKPAKKPAKKAATKKTAKKAAKKATTKRRARK